MPVDDAVKAGAAHSVYRNTEDVIYNPLADSPSTRSFSSSLSNPTRRGLHRRGTSTWDASSSTNNAWTSVHAKSQTTQEVNGHPLGSDSVLHDSGITRPRLTRLIRDPGQTNKLSLDVPDDVRKGSEDRLVLIHEVSPSDTLAGVSLIYGISMADLRRANQLWTSDSIHLRKILHIPLNEASKLKHLRNKSYALQVPNTNKSPESAADTVPTMNIHRVPASRLSFFPPTSQVHPEDSGGITAPKTFPRRYKPPDTGSHRNNAEGSNSRGDIPTFPGISSLFSALPRTLPPSKDGIISRLSLDSNNTSSAHSSDGQEHELDELDNTITRRRMPTYDPSRGSNLDTAICPSGHVPSGVSSAPTIRSVVYRTPQNTSHAHTSGRRYVAEDGLSITSTAIVRTSQLEPSPEMHLPIPARKKSKSITDHGELDLAK